MDYRISVLGFGVGALVGMTGMGGGAVMTPMLILLRLAKPVIAVGTDLVWGSVTKGFGAFVHFRQKTVEPAIVKRLALGSVPGALAGLALLAYLHRQGGDSMNHLVVRMLGVALIVVASSLLLRSLRGSRVRQESATPTSDQRPWLTTVLGLVVGFLVSLTSVGSGSLIIATLVVLYPSTPLKRIVGSDVAHALILVGVSAAGHLGIGSINPHLLVALLIGSIPGVWLGAKLSLFFPENVLRPTLATTLLFLGYKLL